MLRMNPDSKWVNVTWMPHASLSQTSHVCLSIRSAFACLDELLHSKPEDWRIQVSVHGVAGLPLLSVETSTKPAPLQSLRVKQQHGETAIKDPTLPFTYPSVSSATYTCRWDFIVHIPLRWRDLPRGAFLRFHVVGSFDNVLYESELPFFNMYGKLRSGIQRLQLHVPFGNEKGTSVKNEESITLEYETKSQWQESDSVWKASCMLDQLDRFEESKTVASGATESSKAFGNIPSVPWLDAIGKEYCKNVLQTAAEESIHTHVDKEDKSFLIVELPVFEVPVMHEETFYPVPQQGVSGSVTPLALSGFQRNVEASIADGNRFHPLQLVPFLDSENEIDNPVEDKYRTLAHDLLRGMVDPALKPDRVQRDRLAAIIASPSHHPSREEKDLLWRFRFSLVDNRRALTKFLLAVDWTVESEVVQAAELLEQWRKRSPIEVTDALKLLGKQVAYQTNLVRAYAIDTLATAPDDELRLYLLQLVQALKFENIQETAANQATSSIAPVSSLASFLINRAANNIQLANYLYWYLKVELQDPTHGARYREVFAELQRKLSETPFSGVTSADSSNATLHETSSSGTHDSAKEGRPTSFKSIVDSVSKLGSSLRGSEQGSNNTNEQNSRNSVRTVWDVLTVQDSFISGIMDIQRRSRDSRGKKDAKEAQLKSLLKKEGYDKTPKKEPVPLPSAPSIMVNGTNPQSAKIFKSALYPALIEFHVSNKSNLDLGRSSSSLRLPSSRSTSSDSSYKVIVKTGDDLRQDQLVIMIIKLMDGLLKRASLDLCLMPYSIVATSPTSGLVEFVDGSISVSQILANHNNSVMQFFQACNPQQGTKYGVRPEVVSTYVRSCAGYCVITYLLGVGDRHLDNILVTKSGHFFHIDFGFMFGRDPKPLPPAFRLTREMVEGMGGIESTEYRQFCSLACQAFNALRKSAGLVLNLLHLMSDAGIEDLSNNPSADAEGVIAKVEERFRLELTDEQAERYFLGLINDCLTAIAPRVMDVFHSIAVARR